MDAEKLRSLFDLTGRVAIVTGGTRGIAVSYTHLTLPTILRV